MWPPRIVMVPAPACITLRPLPTVPASCFATPHPGQSVVALVLFVLFASLVTPALFPLQLLDPAWQLRLAGTLINGAAFPLLGLDARGFALVGMAAFFAGVVRAPLTGMILVTEMTLNVTLLLPMLAACGTAILVAMLLRDAPIYEALAERAGRRPGP